MAPDGPDGGKSRIRWTRPGYSIPRRGLYPPGFSRGELSTGCRKHHRELLVWWHCPYQSLSSDGQRLSRLRSPRLVTRYTATTPVMLRSTM